MERIPILKMGDSLLVSIQVDMHDRLAVQLQDELTAKISETGARGVLIDITGVPTVDTLTAQHLLKTVTAARLMGADCIISGIRPQIAQTIVHLGVNLNDIITKATLADAFLVALERTGQSLAKGQARSNG